MAKMTKSAPGHLPPSLRRLFDQEGEDVFYSKRPWLAPVEWRGPVKPFVGVDGLRPQTDPINKPYAGEFTKLVRVTNVMWHWANDELDSFEAPMLLPPLSYQRSLPDVRLRRFVAKWDVINRWLTVVHSYVFAYWFTDASGVHHFYQE